MKKIQMRTSVLTDEKKNSLNLQCKKKVPKMFYYCFIRSATKSAFLLLYFPLKDVSLLMFSLGLIKCFILIIGSF